MATIQIGLCERYSIEQVNEERRRHVAVVVQGVGRTAVAAPHSALHGTAAHDKLSEPAAGADDALAAASVMLY